MSQTTDITLPADQLEGTEASFSAWLVKQGDQVTKGQPIAELETDKVAMEVCAPVDGVIQSLTAVVGESVEPEQSLGTISDGSLANDKPASETAEVTPRAPQSAPKVSEQPARVATESASNKDLISPAVRRLIHEHNLSIDNIVGSGKRGRVTRDDVLAYLKTAPSDTSQSATTSAAAQKLNQLASPYSVELPSARPLASTMQPHSNMRKSIASHMVSSLLETSPHVTSVFEMDMGNIIEHRKWHKKEFAELGVKLTFTAYFLAAMAKAVQTVPQVNARFHQHALEIFDDVNIGVGTALGDDGLVVPVVQQVQAMNLFQIAHSLTQQTEKARTGKLTPADMKNGTLTISNHGVSGSLFATPIIINQPQVAILGVGKLEKRVVVEQINGVDQMVIRPKCYVSLSIDHRALDAHQTNLFLAEFVNIIETWGE